MPRTYIIYCEPCNYKKIIENPNEVGLIGVATSPVPGRIPILDPETNKTKTFDHVTTMPKYKCPNCGRAVILKKFNVPKGKSIDKSDQTE